MPSANEKDTVNRLSDYLSWIYMYKREICCDVEHFYHPRKYQHLGDIDYSYQSETDWQTLEYLWYTLLSLPEYWCVDIDRKIVFLKPGDSYTCYYNFVGLRRLGGKYSVVFVGNHPQSFPPIIEFDENKIELPSILQLLKHNRDTYSRSRASIRYDGLFVSDTLIIDFDNATVDIREVKR